MVDLKGHVGVCLCILKPSTGKVKPRLSGGSPFS